MLLSLAGVHFIRPWWGLAILPLILLTGLLYRAKYRETPWEKVCDSHLLARLLNVGDRKSRWPLVLFSTAAFFSIIALTGPTWSEIPVPVFESAENVVIVLDVTRSMDTVDLSPSRLTRAKYKILDLLQKLQGNRVGMIAFTGEAFVVAPLTSDTQTIALLIPSLMTNMMPIAGNDIGSGIQAAQDLLKNSGLAGGRIILFTDTTPDVKANDMAATLPNQNIQLTVVGVGTAAGAPLRDEKGQFFTDQNGNPLLSPLDKSSLAKFAEKAHGHYLDFTQDNSDIDTITQEIAGHQREKTSLIKTEVNAWRDQGRWFLLPVLIIALLVFRRGWSEEVLS